VHRVPGVVPGEEAVAVSARQALDVVVVQHDVERAARAAVGVGDEDALVAAGELLPSIVPRLGGRARIVAVLFSFVLLPLIGAALGWMEGRLKLR